jgi:hypothetical protein
VQIDDQTRTNLNRAFASILRGSPAASALNLQRSSLALFTVIEHTEDGQPIDLGALLFFFTHEAKIPEGAATELLVVLKSREARFPGLSFTLPQSCAALTPEQIASIVAQYNARGGDKAATYEKKPADPLPRKALGKLWVPKQDKGGRWPLSRQQTLLVLCGLLAVGTVINFIVLKNEKPAPLIEITLPVESAGLPCEPNGPPMSNGVARCVVPKALFEKEGPEGLKARGEVTLRAARALGVVRLYVVTKEDRKIRAAL